MSDFCEVLREGWGVSGCKSNNRVTSGMAYVNSNNHCVGEVFWDVDPIQILSDLSVHLFQQISVDSNWLSNRWNQDELRWNSLLVKNYLGGLLLVGVLD